MPRLLLSAVFTISICSAADSAAVRPAIEKSVALLQKTGKNWFGLRPCTSCHHSVLPTLALTTARRHGIRIDDGLALDHFKKAYVYLTDIDALAQGHDSTDSAMNDTYSLWAAHEAGLPPNTASAALARMIGSRQRPEGNWRTLDYRPPQSGSAFTITALSIRSLQLYMSPKLAPETGRRVEQARRWLEASAPRNNEDRAFQLLGLAWSGAAAGLRQKLSSELIAQQRPDGGWPQLSTRASDAYSTGQSIYALVQGGGVPMSNAAVQRGLDFLLKTQQPDGSWLVISRIHDGAPVSPPFFETGFPHGKNQFTSCSGTSWAIMALALTLPVSDVPALSLRELIPSQEPWIETALFGTGAEIRNLDPKLKTEKGTTVLMMAAGDIDKVKSLLDRGADVNARAKTGHSALTAAAAYGNNSQVIRTLFDRGAAVKPPAGTKVQFNVSPLLQAVVSGDLETVKLLVEKGADVNQKSIVFTSFTTSPLPLGAFYNDLNIVEYLAKHGANVNQPDQDGVTPIGGAALSGHAEMVALLARMGANVNHVDRLGMTPLIWASTIEHGGPEVIAKLLAAGARPNDRGKGGVTAMSRAVKYQPPQVRAVLEQAGAK